MIVANMTIPPFHGYFFNLWQGSVYKKTVTTGKGAYKNGKIAKFRSDILKTNEDTTSQYHELKGGFKLGPHNTFVKFRTFLFYSFLALTVRAL